MDALLTLWGDADLITRSAIGLLLIHPVASAITAWTETPEDDKLYGKFYKFVIRPLALNRGLATQDTPTKPTTQKPV